MCLYRPCSWLVNFIDCPLVKASSMNASRCKTTPHLCNNLAIDADGFCDSPWNKQASSGDIQIQMYYTICRIYRSYTRIYILEKNI